MGIFLDVIREQACWCILQQVRQQQLNSSVYFFLIHILFLPIGKRVSVCWGSF